MKSLRKFIRNYQSFIVSGSILLFSLLAIVYGLIPGVKTTSNLIKETQSLRALIKTLEKKLQVLDSLDPQELANNTAAAVSAIPADKSLGTLFSTIDVLTSTQGVSVTGVSLGSVGSVATASASKLSAEEKKLGVNIIPFSLIIEGEITKVRNVVDSAINIRRFFNVQSFDLNFNTETGITSSKLAMVAYYVPDPTSVGKITDPLKPFSEDELSVLEKVSAMPLLTEVIASQSANIQTTPVTVDPFSP